MTFLSLLGQAAENYYSDPSTYDPSMYDSSMYNNAANSQLSEAAAWGFLGVFFLVVLISALIGYAVSAFLLSRIFKKAGVEAWKAWVPIYNSWVLLELGDQKGFWAVLAIIPGINIVSIVFMLIAMHKIGLKLGKEDWFVLLAIFLPLVWMIWLAFDKSTWKGTAPSTPTAVATSAPTPPSTPTTPVETPSKEATPPSNPTDKV